MVDKALEACIQGRARTTLGGGLSSEALRDRVSAKRVGTNLFTLMRGHTKT